MLQHGDEAGHIAVAAFIERVRFVVGLACAPIMSHRTRRQVLRCGAPSERRAIPPRIQSSAIQYSLSFQSFNSPAGVFLVQDNAGPRQASRDEILAAARQALVSVSPRGEALMSPGSVREFLQLRLNPSLKHEVFGVIYLTSQNHVIAYEESFQGTLNQAAVYPREIVKATLAHNAASVILAHNHPSGCADPSRADIDITKRIADALALVDVKVLDHFVIGDPDMTSLAERGLL